MHMPKIEAEIKNSFFETAFSHPASAAAADVGCEAVERAPADQEEDEGDEEEKEELCEEEPA